MDQNAPVITKICDSLPHYSWCSEQIRLMEQQLVSSHKITLYQLMQQAGEAVFHVIKTCWPAVRHLWIFCGKGNNGGDGYVVAKLAKRAGYKVDLFSFDEPPPGIPAEQAKHDWLNDGGTCQKLSSTQGQPDLIIDALLGIGPSTRLRGELLAWIQFINRQQAPILSVDIPSGLNADTGMPLGGAVNAAMTVTLIALKRGLLTGLAADHVGEILLAPLQNKPTQANELSGCKLLNYGAISPLLPPRRRTAHKGDCGKILLAGGGPGMPGAIRLAAEAALRTGAGLVKVFCHPENRPLVFAGRPELMFGRDLSGELIDWADVVVAGPGLGQEAWGLQQWQTLLADAHCDHMIVDADALNHLALHPQKRNNWVLTPHPGEAARLLQCSASDIQSDRFAAVQEVQHRYGGVVLLKGSGTLIFDGRQMAICTEGNPGMASGGMGDVLSGIIAALLGQGLSLFDAACCGAVLHGKAADMIAEQHGERGMLASDLFFWLPKLANPQRYQHGKYADTNTQRQ